MRNFQHKRNWRNVLESRPVLILMGILLLFFAYGMVGFVSKMADTIKNRQIAENKIAELQKNKENLSTNIAKLKTDAGVEENIRDKFGLAKDGEGLIVVVDDKNAPATDESTSWSLWVWIKSWLRP